MQMCRHAHVHACVCMSVCVCVLACVFLCKEAREGGGANTAKETDNRNTSVLTPICVRRFEPTYVQSKAGLLSDLTRGGG